MNAIVASLPSGLVADLARLGPREAAESVAAFLARQAASGSTRFAETVAPLTDPAGPASKSARRAAAFEAKARAAFARRADFEALDYFNSALAFAPDARDDSARRRETSAPEPDVPGRVSTSTAGALRDGRAAVLLRLAAAHRKRVAADAVGETDDDVDSDEGVVASFARLALRDAAAAAAANPERASARLRLGVAARALGLGDTAARAFRDARDRLAATDPARVSVQRRLAEAERFVEARKNRRGTRSGDRGDSDSRGNRAFPETRERAPAPNRVEPRPSTQTRRTPDAGLGLFSTTRVDPGDALVADEPATASVPAKPSAATRCHFCYHALPIAPTPCRACSISVYCDETCRDEDIAHCAFECSETSGCWWSVLPSETRLAVRCLAAGVGDDADADGAPPVCALHQRWSDLDTDARARLAATAAVASHCATRRREDLAAVFSPGAVLEATCAVLGNAFAVKSVDVRSSDRARDPDPRRADAARLAALRAALLAPEGGDARCWTRACLDAWRVLSEETEPVALATFARTSRLNHSCDPNAHVEIRLASAEDATRADGAAARRAPRPVARATTRATRACAAHEELRVSYGPVLGSAPRRARRARLRASHGFACACEACLRDDEGGDRESCVDPADAARWGVVLDEARASFARRDATDATDVAPSTHLRRLETAAGEMRVVLASAGAAASGAARDFETTALHKLIAEALDARALGFVTVASSLDRCDAAAAMRCARLAASSAREALDILAGALGYPEDSLTMALETARVAALDAARGRFEAARADLRRARDVLGVALGADRSRGGRGVDGGFERRALYAVDALLASVSPRRRRSVDVALGGGGVSFELDGSVPERHGRV